MPLAEDTPGYLAQTARGLAEFLEKDEDAVLDLMQAKPEDVEAVHSDQCLESVLANVKLLAPYIYPDLEYGVPNETVKKTSRILWPVWTKARNLILSLRNPTLEETAIKLSKLRSDYLVAVKLKPTIANQRQYLFNRIRLALCHRWQSLFKTDVPAELLIILPQEERIELPKMNASVSEADLSVIERIMPMVQAEFGKVVKEKEAERSGKVSELTSAGTHHKIAERRVGADEDRAIQDLYSPTREELIALATDEKRLNLLVEAIMRGIM